MDVYLTDHIVLNAEGTAVLSTADLEVSTTTLNSLHYISISGGVQYRF